MSTIEETGVVCAVCGHVSAQACLTSYSQFGAPDLDFRPAEMLRGTMRYWIMVCPHCGYAAKKLSCRPRVRRDTLAQIYARADASLPKLAYAFQKHALHRAHRKDTAEAIQSLLWAAWVCDDKGTQAQARSMRQACLWLTRRYMARCPTSHRQRYLTLSADLMRRTGDFEAVLGLDTQDARLTAATRDLLACQQKLARKGDTAAHSQDEFGLEP